jgi:hypothetical protein
MYFLANKVVIMKAMPTTDEWSDIAIHVIRYPVYSKRVSISSEASGFKMELDTD